MNNNQLAIQLSKVASIFDRSNLIISRLNGIGVGIFFALVCVTFVDVFLRYVFNRPLKGVLDITELLLIVVVYFGIAYTQNKKGHVSIDLITGSLSPRARLVMDAITTIISIGVFAILIWQTFDYLLTLIRMNLQAEAFALPVFPFAALIPLGCTLLLVVLLRDLLTNIVEGLRLHLMGYQWLLVFGIPVLVAILAILWVQPLLWQLSLPIVGVIGAVFVLVFFFTGMPISFVMIMIGFLFMAHIRGVDSGLAVIGIETFASTANYVWATIAFFLLMSHFVLFARMGEDLYYAAYKWLGHLSGGLAIATVAACTAFAGIVGDMISATVTFTAVALPEMRKYKYSDRLSTGVIASGATLGPLIPPSITFIVYGVLTGVSIGKLLVAGILPGLLISVAYMATVYTRCRVNPSLGVPGPRAKWGERLGSLKGGGPVALLFLLVIGGIYAGIFTPSEGGGIGAFGAFAIALSMRRLSSQRFVSALLGAGQVTAMVFLIITGGTMLTRFFVSCNFYEVATQFLTGLAMPPLAIVIVIIFMMLVLGCFIESLPLMLIGVPLFHPIAVGLGFDPLWFAVLLVISIHLGMITPPVGAVLFALKGVEKEIPIATIYRGILPFILATLVALVIIIVFPQIATCLPNILKG